MGLALVINAGQQITGQGSLNSYSTKIYQKVFTSDSQIALINALNATFGILFTLNAVWIIDRFGRKFLLIVGGIGMGLCMIIVSAVETQTPSLANGSKSEPVGISIVFLLFLFIFFCKFFQLTISHKGKNTDISQTNHPGAQQYGSGHPRSSQ
jgi:MFS family permease